MRFQLFIASMVFEVCGQVGFLIASVLRCLIWLVSNRRPHFLRIYFFKLPADLATYDRSKRILLGRGMKDNALTHACCSAMSGLAAATVSTPADVIKTRIMNQLKHSSGAVA